MRIEHITKKCLDEATDLELKQLKYKMAKLWDNHFKTNDRAVVGCFTRSGFISKYRMLLNEMDSSKRSLQHSTCDIDRQAFKQTMQVKKDGIDIAVLSNIVVHKNHVFLDENFATSKEIMITVQSSDQEPDEHLEKTITEMFNDQFDKPFKFIYKTDFEGSCLPLYQLILSSVGKLEKVEIKNNEDEGEHFNEPIEIIPIDKGGDEHIVYGIVYEPDTEDAQGDKASAAEIKKAAYDFMEHCQDFKVMHKGKKVKIKILENYIAPVNFSIGKRKVKKGSWVLVTRVLDKDVWEDIKSGKLTGYSMAGYAKIA